MFTSSNKCVTYNQFTRLWTTWCTNVVIPRKVRILGYCSICKNLKAWPKGAKTTKEDINKNWLQDHHEAQALERNKAMYHRDKSLKNPKQYMCLMIDGMDQKKTCLPHI